MSDDLLTVDGLTVMYGGIIAVRDIAFTVAKGEIVALLGANGAGKSSTLQAVAGAVSATGAVRLRNEEIQTLTPAERVAKGIVLCPEGRRIFPYLTVQENLLAGAFLSKSPKETAERMEYGLSLFPLLRERLQQPGRTLSGGEQQMLAIARALMANPELLLLDEPSLGLAPVVAKTIFHTLNALRDAGVSLLLVEQNANAALKLADRAYVLETGIITHNGAADELARNVEVRKAYLGG
ncbi:MAG: ABC transporter ATP-binding protein [bacterium]|nr:ABC transporter ATP-binding protein [bacterium]